jgi:hypothetical protein
VYSLQACRTAASMLYQVQVGYYCCGRRVGPSIKLAACYHSCSSKECDHCCMCQEIPVRPGSLECKHHMQCLLLLHINGLVQGMVHTAAELLQHAQLFPCRLVAVLTSLWLYHTWTYQQPCQQPTCNLCGGMRFEGTPHYQAYCMPSTQSEPTTRP